MLTSFRTVSILVTLGAVVVLAAPRAHAQSLLQGCQRTVFTWSTSELDPDTGVQRTIMAGSPGFPVVAECGSSTISADRLEHASNTLVATGNVLIQQPGMRISADRAELSLITQLGIFDGAHGFLRVGDQPLAGQPLGTQKTDMEFYAERIEKVGARSYKLTNGRFTACAQAAPRWQFTMTGGTITLDKHALMRNAVLHVKNVPIFYLPFIYYPIDSGDRATGFLMPSYGASTIRGSSVSNAFFWALGRSQDVTFFHDWFTRAGQGAGAEYRIVSAPGSGGNLRFYLIDEKERVEENGLISPARRSFDMNGDVNQTLGGSFRLVGRLNYFSDVATQQRYDQNVYDLSNRSRAINMTVTGNVSRARLTATTEIRDYFYGADEGQRQGRLPQVNLTLPDRPVGRSPIYFGAFGDVAYLLRQDDLNQPDTNFNLWRFDAAPRVRVPVSTLSFLTATTTASWRVTRWFDSRDPATGLKRPEAILRSLFEVRTDVVGPTVARVFQTPDNGYAERFKHLIEPFVSFQWFSPFERREEVIQIDGVDSLVGGSMQVTYGVTNRVLARRRMGASASAVRDILSVGVRQTYYTDLLAAAFDSQYSSATATPSPFSPLRLNVDVRPADGLTGQFVTDIDPTFKTPRQFSASATVNRERLQVSGSWSKRRVIDGLPGWDDPAFATHYLSASTSVNARNNRAGAGYSFNYDVQNARITQQRISGYYNAQCCGITMEYQTISFGSGGFITIPEDRRFGISFSLAGLASFSNPFGSFGR
ncbi:MAG TPA: putative LPS assembly protein LptD [Vicinamibacterales bacterium]|nr:putative LPS assembly protein LptD [Vicinamibacterales bacterium]